VISAPCLLVPVALSYGLGICLYEAFGLSGVPGSLMVLIPGLSCLISFKARLYLVSSVLLCLTFFLFALVHTYRSALPLLDRNHIVYQTAENGDVVIVGTLAGKISRTGDIDKALIDISHVRVVENGPFHKSQGRVLISVKGVWPEQIKPGDAAMIRTALHHPPVNNTPGTFNYREYLARKHVYLSGTVNHPILISPIPQLQASFSKTVRYRMERMRSAIGAFIDDALPPDTGAVYKALLIGDRSEIPAAILDIFKRSGILHMLAVSGMHTGLIAALLYGTINWLLRRSVYIILHVNVRKASLLATLPALFFYMLLTGANPPVIRAFTMITVFITAFILDRLQNPLITLAAAGFLILLFDPAALFTPSFQLSFAAVAAILLFVPKINLLLNAIVPIQRTTSIPVHVARVFVTIGIVTTTATIGTLPLMLYHFNRISLVTLPANLLIQPLICLWSLPVGIVSLAVAAVSPETASIFLKAGAAGISASIQIGEFLSAPERSQLWISNPPISACVLYYLGLLVIAVNRPWKCSIPASVIPIAISTGIFFLPLAVTGKHPDANGMVSVLDVGHGSANVIETTDGRVILIDGGSKSAPGFDCGDRVISPFLWQRRIARINDIIVTHDDADHYNGLATVIERFRPNRLFIPPVQSSKKGFQLLIDAAVTHNVSVIQLEKNTMLGRENERLFIYLADDPDAEEGEAARSLREDDKGLVMKLVAGSFSVMFPGDITSVKETELADRLAAIAADILISPHHGSSSSNSLAFLESVNPDYLIFSARDYGKGLFPSTAALVHAQTLQIKTITTSKDGSVLITYDGASRYRIDTYSRSGQRFYRRG